MTLTYGDHITGHIVSVTRAAVRIQTPAADLIQIDRKYVAQLGTDEPRVVDLSSGERVIGQLVADTGDTILIRSSLLGERRVSLDAIDAIQAVDSIQLGEVRGKGAGAAQPQQPPSVGQPPEDREDIRKIFLRQATVLLAPGQLEVETAFNYLHTQSVSTVLNARFRQFQLPLAARIGLFNRAEGFLSVPVGHVRQDLGFADSAISHHESGVGDVVAGFNYELARETAGTPDIITSVSLGAPSGSKPNAEGLSLGTGHWAADAAVQFIRTVDPVALFAGVRYEHQFKARHFLGDAVHQVDPGETAGYNFGVGFAVNENVSLSTQVVGSYQSTTQADGQDVFASSREPVSLRSALTFRYSKGTYVEPSIVVGLDQDTPDFALGMSLTHRFGP